jgi:hypothetical protein
MTFSSLLNNMKHHQKRKTGSIVILLGLIGLLIWRYYHLSLLHRDEAEAPIGVQAPEMSESPKRISMRKIQPDSKSSTARPTQSENSYAKKPEGPVVEFQIVDGLAVAYGDIILGKPDPEFQGSRGHAEVSAPQLWDKGEIPYVISPDLPNPSRVEKAIEYFRQNTPVRFVPYQNHRDALVFAPGTEHCMSNLGRTGGLQPIMLSPGCQTQAIIHEIMHALGFVHEQSRSDRDQYVEVVWENIEEKYQPQFAIVPEILLEPLRGSPFDYRSIMLYEPTDFAIRPNVFTLKTRGSGPIAPVQHGLSEIDIERLNKLYGL